MKKRVLRCLSIILSITGVIIISVTLYLHFDYKAKMDELLSNRVILVGDNKDDVNEKESVITDEDSVESDIVDFTIEGMEEDQEIGEIKTGTPVISIPRLDITVPVIDGTSSTSLKLGAGKFEHSVEMGEVGNFAVAGHSSTIYNCIFNNLENIELLDVIECYNSEGSLFKYYVTDKFKTSPDNVGVTLSSSQPTMTIVTCTDGGTNRFIVSARLMTDAEYKEYSDNLKSIQVDKAIVIAKKYSDVDVTSYFESGNFISKIPYQVKYLPVEDIPTFFSNYTIFKDKLKVNEHDMYISFNQSIGIDFISLLSEVSEK